MECAEFVLFVPVVENGNGWSLFTAVNFPLGHVLLTVQGCPRVVRNATNGTFVQVREYAFVGSFEGDGATERMARQNDL